MPLSRAGRVWTSEIRLIRRKATFTQAAKVIAPGLVDKTQGVLATPFLLNTPEMRQLGVRYVFFRKDCNEQCGPLQIIQVCYGTPHLDHEIGEQLGGYRVLVDAGPKSPRRLYLGHAPGHPTRPYFYPPHMHRVEQLEDRIRLADVVGAARRQEQLFCEVACVCIRHHGGNHDKVTEGVSYGWNDFGNVRIPRPNGPIGVDLEARQGVSARFRKIVRREFQNYADNLIDW